MIALSSTVLAWYQQQIAPPLAIFKDAADKKARISIHQVINLNAGGLGTDPHHHMGNTLNLLKLRRKRGALEFSTLCHLCGPHQVTGARIFRAWRRSLSR